MWEIKSNIAAVSALHTRQTGTAAVEFALLAILFFTLVFGIIEMARVLFVYQTVHEVTRRAAAAAANVYPTDTAKVQQLKQQAIFRSTPGELLLATPVTDQYVRIDYMALPRDPASGSLSLSPMAPSSWSPSAAQNRHVCMGNPNAADCIRFVRVRICDVATSNECQAAELHMLLPLVDLRVPLPFGETIVSAESLGYTPGSAP